MLRTTFFTAMLIFTTLACQPTDAQQTNEEPSHPEPLPLQGAWQPERYILAAGDEQAVTGQIFFAEEDWTVLFFVLGEDGQPKRGSGEGGTYTLHGDSLTFTHRYHLSGGEATGSLPSSPMRMEIHEAADADTEPCTITIEGEVLSILFPSGNTMTFRRRSGMTL